MYTVPSHIRSIDTPKSFLTTPNPTTLTSSVPPTQAILTPTTVHSPPSTVIPTDSIPSTSTPTPIITPSPTLTSPLSFSTSIQNTTSHLPQFNYYSFISHDSHKKRQLHDAFMPAKKKIAGGFNCRLFSDVVLQLKQSTYSKYIYVSKAYLGIVSTYFKTFFQSNLNDNNNDYIDGLRVIPLELSSDEKLDIMEDALRCAYLEYPISGKQNLTHLLITAIKYDIKPTIDQNLKIILDDMKDPSKSLEYACQYLALLKNDQLTQCSLLYHQISKFVYQCEEQIRTNFKTMKDIFYEKKEEFLKLPVEALVVVLNSSALSIDSEGSLFYAIVLWALAPCGPHEPPHTQRDKLLYKVWPHIRFCQLRKYFLLDIVPYVAKLFNDSLLEQLSEMALESIIIGLSNLKRCNTIMSKDGKAVLSKIRYDTKDENNSDLVQKQHPNIYFTLTPRLFLTNKSLSFRCAFRSISKLTRESRYYSSPVYIHGYEFYYFIKQQKIDPMKEENDENLAIGGYLRCASKILPPKFYLPIKSTVIVSMEGLERYFKPSSVIFETSEKAIGGKLTLSNENWKSVKQGLCPIVVDDTITAVVTVEFLNSDEGCMVVD